MQLLSIITTVAALTASVYAVPSVDERSVVKAVISVNDPMIGSSYSYGDSQMMMDSAPSQASPSMYPSAALSAAPSSNTQYVVVGGTAGLVYTPEYVSANIGDVVVFHYGVKNHTLTQSSFAEPCTAMGGGQNSGFMPTDGSTTPEFSVIVTTTSPQWFYCQQADHCQQGMVFAINPPTSGNKTFSDFKSLAMGQTTVTATATAAATVIVPPPPASSAPAPPPGTVAGTNIGSNGQCFCVCNLALSNGVPNPQLQGLDTFGGMIGQVQSPFAANVAAAPAPPPAASAPASSAVNSASGVPLVGAGLGSLNVGTVQAFGNAAYPPASSLPTPTVAASPDPPATTGDPAATATNPAGDTSDDSTAASPTVGSENPAAFAANPPGGAAGRLFKVKS